MDYTRVPNFFFDHMADMDKCEQPIVLLISRHTLGYQKEWDEISLSQFEQTTGMKRASVTKGIQAALERGIIERRAIRNSFEYRVCDPGKTKVDENGSKIEPIDQDSLEIEPRTVQKLNQNSSKNEPKSSSEIEPKPTNSSKNEPKSVQKLNTQKKKEITTNTSLRGKDAAQPSLNGGPPTEHQQMFAKICDIVGWDHKALDEKSQGQVAQTLGILKKAGYTLADLTRFGTDVWALDWRWIKQKQRPTLVQLRQEIGKLKAPGFTANGSTAGKELTWAEKFANQDIPDYILKMQRGEGP
jgi:hypothetical protein